MHNTKKEKKTELNQEILKESQYEIQKEVRTRSKRKDQIKKLHSFSLETKDERRLLTSVRRKN